MGTTERIQKQIMKHHPYADLLPMMEEPDILTLGDSMEEIGQKHPIWTLDGMVLDGRNRLAACKLKGLEPIFREHKNGDPLKFVEAMNFARRHLTQDQKAMFVAKVLALKNAESSGNGSAPPGRSTKEAIRKEAQKAGVGQRTVERAASVLKNAPDKVSGVEMGEITLKEAAKTIKPKAPKQGRETWGPKDRKAASQALGKFIRIVDKAPFWGDIRGLVDAIAKELKR